MILGLGFSGNSLNLILALGHVSNINDLANPHCTSFSTALQMFLVALDELDKKSWEFIVQEKGIMIAATEFGKKWISFLLAISGVKKSARLESLMRDFERMAANFNWKKLDSVAELSENIDTLGKHSLKKKGKLLDKFNKFRGFNKKIEYNRALLKSFFWVLEGLEKQKEISISLYLNEG